MRLQRPLVFNINMIRRSDQFAHATAIMILTPEGKIAQYFYGVEFAPKDLRLGLVQASQNKIGTVGRPGVAVLLSLRSGDREIRRHHQRILQLVGRGNHADTGYVSVGDVPPDSP